VRCTWTGWFYNNAIRTVGYGDYFTSHKIRVRYGKLILELLHLTVHSLLYIYPYLVTGIPLWEIQYALGHRIGSDTIKYYLNSISQRDVLAMSHLVSRDLLSLRTAVQELQVQYDPAAPLALTLAYCKALFAKPQVATAFSTSTMASEKAIKKYSGIKLAPASVQQEYQRLYRSAASIYNRFHSAYLTAMRKEWYKLRPFPRYL